MRCEVVGFFVMVTGVVVALPGSFLLIVNRLAARVNAGILEVDFGGGAISAESVISWSIWLSLPFMITSAFLAAIGIQRRKTNNS